MARESMPWFRFWVETIWDPKVRRLDPDLRWLWAAVMACARQSPTPGVLLVAEGVPMVVDDLADAAALPPARVDAGLSELMRLGMLVVDDESGAWVLPNWEVRQPASDGTSTERSRRSRATAKQRSGDVAATGSESESDPESDIPPSISGLTRYGLDPLLVVDLIARQALKDRQAKGGESVRSPEAWLRRARTKATEEHAEKIMSTARAFAVRDEAELADLVLGRRNTVHVDRRAS